MCEIRRHRLGGEPVGKPERHTAHAERQVWRAFSGVGSGLSKVGEVLVDNMGHCGVTTPLPGPSGWENLALLLFPWVGPAG